MDQPKMVRSLLLLLWRRGAVEGGADEKVGFRFVRQVQLQSLEDEVQPDVVRLAGFERQMHRLTYTLGGFFEGAGLPLGANIVFSRIGGEKEIGLAIACADPLAIYSNAHGWGTHKINKKIDQGFPIFGLANGMLRIVRLYVE